jgi:hypothetical protein
MKRMAAELGWSEDELFVNGKVKEESGYWVNDVAMKETFG